MFIVFIVELQVIEVLSGKIHFLLFCAQSARRIVCFQIAHPFQCMLTGISKG